MDYWKNFYQQECGWRMWESFISPQARSRVRQEERISNSRKDTKPFLLSYHRISVFLVGILNHSSVCIVAEESHAFSNLHICQTPQGRMEKFKYSSLYLNLNNAKKICSSFISVTKIYNTWIIRSHCCTETVPVDISEIRKYITSAQIDSFLQIWIIYIPIITMASDYLNF